MVAPVSGARKSPGLRNQFLQLAQQAFLSSTAPPARNILVNFVEGRGLAAQAMALDHRTSRYGK